MYTIQAPIELIKEVCDEALEKEANQLVSRAIDVQFCFQKSYCAHDVYMVFIKNRNNEIKTFFGKIFSYYELNYNSIGIKKLNDTICCYQTVYGLPCLKWEKFQNFYDDFRVNGSTIMSEIALEEILRLYGSPINWDSAEGRCAYYKMLQDVLNSPEQLQRVIYHSVRALKMNFLCSIKNDLINNKITLEEI